MSNTASSLTPEQLLAGPRGRRLLLEFAQESEREASPELGSSLGLAVHEASYRLAKLDGQAVFRFGAVSGAEVPAPIPAVFPDEVARALAAVPLAEPTVEVIRSCLAESVDSARYWQGPDGEDLLAAIPAIREALGRVAERVASSPSASWLAAAADHQDQWRLRWREADEFRSRPAVAVLKGWRADAVGWEAEADALGSGEWWSTPPHGLPVTCGTLPGGAPSGLWFVEDGLGWEQADARRVTVPSGARIYEIHGPDDWARLCRDHPLEVTRQKQRDWHETTGRAGRWVVPDWSRVAERYAAVHLGYVGYLSAAGVPIPVDDETASLIAGWNPDATYWLTDVEEAGDPIPWRCHGYVGEGDWRV